jgi:hypothetical protein
MHELHPEKQQHASSHFSGGSSDDASLVVFQKTIHELEGKLIKENLAKLKVKEQQEALAKTVGEYRVKYQELVESEVGLRKQLLENEREKLRLSKALVDLQLENSTLMESIEKEKFDITTKLLNAENDILELQMREDQAMAEKRAAVESVAKAMAEKRELATEFVALKSNFVALNNTHQKEIAKSQQLSVELLTLVNHKRSLSMVKDGTILFNIMIDEGWWAGVHSFLIFVPLV